ncbi:hypothetical protein LTR86_004836 [Recurvomyces mirabilis]|nr:hypothetical protein LTR86_004836 [Recurvomyces mirabilis]
MSGKTPDMRYAPPPPLKPSKAKEPKKRSKLHALWLKVKIDKEEKKRGGVGGETASSLLLAAHSLNDDIGHVTHEAQLLMQDALKTPRPGTPPTRDPLFQRPRDAPLSDYEKSANAYISVVDRYRKLNDKARSIQQRFSTFQEDVKTLKIEHPPGKKFGKYEYDIESLDNASRNIETTTTRMVEAVGQAREAAR